MTNFSCYDHHPSRKLGRFVGVVSLILGGWLFISGLNNIPIISNVTANTSPLAVLAENTGNIKWQHSLKQAKQLAQSTGKPIFIRLVAK